MTLAPGTHQLGPDNASLKVKTYREGVAAKVGHDLVIEVTRWEVRIDSRGASSRVELTADSTSLEVRSGERGVKPLTDKDRAEIRKNIDEKVLNGKPITFRSTEVREEDSALAVDGDLTMAGSTRPVSARFNLAADGQVSGTIPLTQSEWGIKPYRGLMGALKVRDDVEIVLDGRLPTS
jgi:polyisoprenoid-binding protein YceI